MSDKSDTPRAIKVFIGDSVPTAHLKQLQREIENRSAPTGHLPMQIGIREPGASVPTGHLPSTVPSPAPSPSTGSGNKK